MKLRILAFATLAALCIVSCKKNTKDDDETAVTQQLTQHSDDQSRISTEMDAADNDVNTAVESTPSFGRVVTTTTTQPPCDATITFDSTATMRMMIITFNGDTCNPFRTRTGKIYVMQPRAQHWGQAGSTLRDSIVNLKITRRSDNKSITVNGLRTVTNVSGGRIFNIAAGATIVHTVDATMTITFDDGSQRQWQAARKRTYTRPGTSLNLAVTGNHSDGGYTDIAEWGTNRYGNPFRTRITEPLQIKQEWNFRLGGGKVVHTGLAHSLEVTYGLDIQGQPVTSYPGNTNPYYYKVVWTGANGNSITVIRPYY